MVHLNGIVWIKLVSKPVRIALVIVHGIVNWHGMPRTLLKLKKFK